MSNQQTKDNENKRKIIKIGVLTITIIVTIGIGVYLERNYGTVNKIINNFQPNLLKPSKTISNKFKPITTSVPQDIKKTGSYIAQTVSVKSFVRNLPEGQNASIEKLNQAKALNITLKKGTTLVDSYQSTRYAKSQIA